MMYPQITNTFWMNCPCCHLRLTSPLCSRSHPFSPTQKYCSSKVSPFTSISPIFSSLVRHSHQNTGMLQYLPSRKQTNTHLLVKQPPSSQLISIFPSIAKFLKKVYPLLFSFFPFFAELPQVTSSPSTPLKKLLSGSSVISTLKSNVPILFDLSTSLDIIAHLFYFLSGMPLSPGSPSSLLITPQVSLVNSSLSS